MSPNPENVLAQLDRIESEMKRIGMWQNEPLEPDQYDFRAAFASDTMAFSQWLQFIFIPSVRIAADENRFPASSNVATQAIREFDGVDAASSLIGILSAFDALFA